MIGLLARKIGMTQLFDAAGRVVPVTLLVAGPCKVVQLKTPARDGYSAVQLGFGSRRAKCQTAPVIGHMKKHGAAGMRTLMEVRVDDAAVYQEGQELNVTLLEIGSKVDVTCNSKGRGFAGVVKRHHFSGGRATHGCVTHKQPGSIGASAYPSRVIKGKRLPGRMGGKRVTVKNLEVIGVDAEQHLVWVRGSVPGAPNGTVLIRRTT